MTFKNVFITSLILVTSLFAGVEKSESGSYQSALDSVKVLLKKHKPEEILFVSDIDNTLLATKSLLGSDQWYTWKDNQLDSGTVSDTVLKSHSDLLMMQSVLHYFQGMRTCEVSQKKTVKEIIGTGVNFLLLTSRGPEARSYTEQALQNNYGEVLNSLESDLTFASLNSVKSSLDFFPYEYENELLKPWFNGYKPGRHVDLENGLFLTSGSNKGLMLHYYLKLIDKPIKAIVFIDDTPKHIAAMGDLFGPTDYEFDAIQYNGELKNVEELKSPEVQSKLDKMLNLFDKNVTKFMKKIPNNRVAVEAKPVEKKAEANPAEKKAEAKTAEKKAEAKPSEKKADAKPAEKKADAKPAEKKAEAKTAEKKAEAKPAEKKADAKPAEKKADAKPAEKKAEANPVEKKAEAKSEEKKADAAE